VKNKLIGLLIICITFLILNVGLFLIEKPPQVRAAGSVSANISQSNGTYVWSLNCGTYAQTFSYFASKTTADSYSASSYGCGWSITGSTSGMWYSMTRGKIGFDLSSISQTAQILSVSLWTCGSKSESSGVPSDWQQSYCSFYKTLDSSGANEISDYSLARNQGSIMLFHPKKFADLSTVSNTWTEWTMYSGYLNQLLTFKDANGRVWFTMGTMRDMYNPSAQPSWITGFKQERYSSSWGAGMYPYLIINYVADSVIRTIVVDPNGTVNPAPTGEEVANNITWGSPRCAFADEQIFFKVNGEWGANVTLKCVGDDGSILAAHQDSIRDNLCYNWSFTISPSYEGWVRCIEDKFSLVSEWGRVEPSPSSTMVNLTCYAKRTEYPQYDYPFSDYAVYKDGLMYYYWKTNIESGNITNYNFALWPCGNNGTSTFYNSTLNDINTNIYKCTANNTFLAAYRYLIFTPFIESSGFNNRDGLIYNLNQEYNLSTSGFIVPIIYNNNTEGVLTNAHSAYFYVKNAETDGLKMWSDTGVMAGSVMNGYINCGQYSHVADNLGLLALQTIDNSGNVRSGSNAGVVYGANEVSITAPSDNGNFQLRFTFSDNTKSPYYSYIHDVDFTVGGGELPSTSELTGTTWQGILGKFKNFLARWGLDNTLGHCIIILFLCILVAIFFRKLPAVATGLILLIIAAGFIADWLPKYLLVLLCITAGIIIYGLFRKATHTQAEG
jgi:hypothetical protein